MSLGISNTNLPPQHSQISKMADPSSSGPSLPTSQATPLLTSFTTFLTITLHTLLYHRGLYPSTTFLTARAYNLPVHQSRHPGLCKWISDAVAAVLAQLQSGSVRRIALVMHAPKSLAVLERWVFDVAEFPVWGESKELGKEDYAAGRGEGAVGEDEESVNWTDVNEALRGALRRIAYAAEGMPALPEGSTFTLAVELRDEAPAPIGVSHPIFEHVLRMKDWLTLRSIPNPGFPHNPTSNHPPTSPPTKAQLAAERAQRPSAQCKLVRCSLNAGWKTAHQSQNLQVRRNHNHKKHRINHLHNISCFKLLS